MIQVGKEILVYEYEKDHIPPRRRGKRTKARTRVSSRRYDNVQRVRKSFVRLVQSNLGRPDAPFLVTFTMLAVVPLHEAYADITSFFKRLRERYGDSFAYVGVPEFQERGAVHFHVLVWGIPVDVWITEGSFGKLKGGSMWRWFRYLQENGIRYERLRNTRALQHQWQRGYLDCVPTDNSPKLASYMAKYMLKAVRDERLAGNKAYFGSRNLMRPVSLVSKTQIAFAFDAWELGVDSKPTYVSSFDTMWLGRCKITKYKI